jgi:hypothetical protein
MHTVEVNNHITNTIMFNDLASATHLSLGSDLPSAHSEVPLVHGAGLFTLINDPALSHPQSGVTYSVHRVEHQIHGINQVMHLLDSHGCEPLLAPPPCELLECGDLYIHWSLSMPTTCQIQGSWEDVQENQVHPLLPMHHLWLGANKELIKSLKRQ